MGNYTEIFVNVDLRKNTPEEVITVLREICSGDGGESLKDKPSRWAMLFGNASYYTPLTHCANLTFDNIRGAWSLIGKGDIKNYNGEIEAFFAWISPWVDGNDGDFIGYHRYEESQHPTLVYLGVTANDKLTARVSGKESDV